MRKPLLETVAGLRQATPPLWIMRQAGRYLPEYREVRARAGSFLDLCYNPELAAEVTLQPLRRFDVDAAILFSDILVIPDALGQTVRFEVGEGPRLEPISPEGLGKLRPDNLIPHLMPVLETLQRVKSALAPEKTLIGFCGSPWTVATYMIAGQGSTDQAAARIFALTQADAFKHLIDILVEASIAYLVAQLRAGADVVQLFESWALNLDEVSFFDREAVFIERMLTGLVADFPALKVVFEHITTADAAAFVEAAGPNLAATITPHHLAINRNAMFDGGIRPHFFCLPVAKREAHRLALRRAATSGSAKFFIGTDSAPHAVGDKESACGCAGIFNAPFALESYATVFDEEGTLDRLEAFTSENGPRFYGLPLNEGFVTLERKQNRVPERIELVGSSIVPFHAGEVLRWSLSGAG